MGEPRGVRYREKSGFRIGTVKMEAETSVATASRTSNAELMPPSARVRARYGVRYGL